MLSYKASRNFSGQPFGWKFIHVSPACYTEWHETVTSSQVTRPTSVETPRKSLATEITTDGIISPITTNEMKTSFEALLTICDKNDEKRYI